tara:strand:- start:1088 stop:1627 length:540 start_codon:yes stop_codon:yes gene_type:complete
MLTIVIGPMYSGKTSYILNAVNEFEILKEKYLVFNNYLDTRYNIGKITNHNQVSIESHSIKKISDILNFENLTDYKHILIDETQFFDDLYSSINLIMNKYPNLNITCVGLDGDYKQEAFNDGQLLKLIPKTDNLIRLYSKCYQCNKKAPYTKRIINDDNQIIIASQGVYVPCCRNCLVL